MKKLIRDYMVMLRELGYSRNSLRIFLAVFGAVFYMFWVRQSGGGPPFSPDPIVWFSWAGAIGMMSITLDAFCQMVYQLFKSALQYMQQYQQRRTQQNKDQHEAKVPD